MPELSKLVREYLRKRGMEEPQTVEVSEYFWSVGGAKSWEARVIVEGVQDAATCEALGKYLAKRTGAKLKATPIFVSAGAVRPSSCWIELGK